jgi:hypothetical protein
MIRATNFKAGNGPINPAKAASFFDTANIHRLAQLLKVELPKNLSFNDQLQLYKSKQFICNCKTIFFTRLHQLTNKANDVELNFERSQFKFYTGFVG